MASREQIRLAREARGMSQDDVAKGVGVKQPTITRIESGETRRSKAPPDVERFLGLAPAEPHPTELEQAMADVHQLADDLRAFAVRLDEIRNRLAKPHNR